MAILWADGFDDWGGAGSAPGEYTTYNASSMTVGGTGGRRGSGCVSSNNGADYLQKQLPATYTELYAAVAYKPNVAGSTAILTFYSGTTAMLTLRVNADGSISAYRGTWIGTLLGTSASGVVPVSAWTHVQVRVVFSATVGIVQVRLNGAGTNTLSLTSQNTGGASANAVQIGAGSANSCNWDDFVVSDTSGSIANSWLGDVRVDSYLPNGDGDLSQMTGSDGNSASNHLLVDAASPNGTDYVQSATVGHEDLYQMADVAHAPVAILGVVCTASAKTDDAGARSIRLHAKSGGTDVASPADIALSTSRARVSTVFEADPATGAAWTKAGLNAAQFGFSVTV